MSEQPPVDLKVLVGVLDSHKLCWKLSSRFDDETAERVYTARVWRPNWPALGYYGRKVRAADPVEALTLAIELSLKRKGWPRRKARPTA